MRKCRKLMLMSIFFVFCSLGFSKTFFQVYLNDASLANLREKPSSSSKILDVYEEKGDWLYITYGDSPHIPVAYVHRSQVKKEK